MSMDSCEKHGWWEVNELDVCPGCLIHSLRAEVEKEAAGKRSFYELMLQAERERDEALAQVAVLIKAADNLADWVETHGCFGETQKKESGDCPLDLQNWDHARRNVSNEARALLDRLHALET